MRYEYKTVRIENQNTCLSGAILDSALNDLAREGWSLVTILPHQCKNSQLCLLAIFSREKRTSLFNINYPPYSD